MEAANAFAIKIQRAIMARNSINFCNIDNVKELWKKVIGKLRERGNLLLVLTQP